MFRVTQENFRRRTAWRDLLHPLPISARKFQWLKRDAVEINEEILRRPYYKFRSEVPQNQTLRDERLRNPKVIGPELPEDVIPRDVRMLRHAHPESYETVVPHSQGRY